MLDNLVHTCEVCFSLASSNDFFRSHQTDLHKINRGSGWKMKTVPLVAHVMNEDWGQAKTAACSR